ncbi:hypothetical protein Fmac_032284 [Flemingia macrophylla]|uniref:EGF-like domain-containing protein n=1 Tax=Flemingia macrophylla TaxID=520843 RepID=A0ABD1L4W7_9FABA
MEPLQLREVLMFALALAMVVVAVALASDQIQTLPGCNSTCGNIQIPYPFGVGNSSTQPQQPCYLEPKFHLVCNNSNSNLLWSNLIVLSINGIAHQMDLSFWVARFCNDSYDNNPWIRTADFSVSRKENKFLTVDIPPRMRRISSVQAATFSNSTRDCSYSFLAKHNSYDFSTSHLQSFPYKTLPLVVDWTVGEQNCSRFESSRNEYACKDHSHCNDTDTDIGYRCTCDHGYQGNPYLGCTVKLRYAL